MTRDDHHPALAKNRPRLTAAQRDHAIREIQSGRTQTSVAAELGVTRSAVSLLWVAWSNRKVKGFSKVLDGDEQAQLKAEMLQSAPKDHGLAHLGGERGKIWTGLRAHALAEQRFGRKLNKLPIAELTRRWRRDLQPRTAGAMPDMPSLEIDEDDLDPELRNDPDFMAYIRSPIARQIRERELEAWKRDEQNRRRRGESPLPDMEPEADRRNHDRPFPASPPPLVRTGKHKRGKGSPFTKPKRKKRK